MKKLILIVFTLNLNFAFAQIQKNGDELIDQALSEKRITKAQAFLHKINLRFHPELVPTEFQGPVDENATHLLVMQVNNHIQEYDAKTQKELVGFMIPPVYEGSHFMSASSNSKNNARVIDKDNELPIPEPLPKNADWKFIENSEVRVWYQGIIPEDLQKAQNILITFPNVRRKLDALMGKTYLSDAGAHRFKDINGDSQVWGDGGNGKLDVYVGPLIGALALTVPYPPGCSEKPAFILLRNTMAGGDRLEPALSHEYMHVLSFAFEHGRNCAEYTDVDEGIANWAMNYVNPARNYEHNWDNMIRYAGAGLIGSDYDGWPFFLYLEKTFNPQIIPSIFKNYSLLSNWEAVDYTISGGFKKHYPLFTTKLWNQIDDLEDLRDYDHVEKHPLYNNGYDEEVLPVEVKANSKGNFSFKKEFKVRPLAVNYFHFKFTDPKIRSIDFEAIPKFEMTQKLKLKVMVKRFAKAWEIEDWENKEDTTEACRDIHDDKIEEIVFAFSNINTPKSGVDWTFGAGPKIHWEFNVSATNIGCNRHSGNFESSMDYTYINGNTGSLTVTSDAIFEREGVNDTNHFIGRFWVTSGKGKFHFQGTVKSPKGSTCSGSTSSSFAIVTKKRGNSIGLYPHQVNTSNERKYTANIGAISPSTFPVTYVCPAPEPAILGSVAPIVLSTGMAKLVDPDGALRGMNEVKTSETKLKFKWEILPLDY